MAVTLNKANLVLKDANGNIGKIAQLSDRDLAKIKTALSDVTLVVNQSNHTPIEATTTNKGVVQLATSVDVASGAVDKVVTAEQLHNATTGTSALAAENLARIDAVVTEAGISVDHTNTNQLKTAVTTLISNATPATATSDTVGVVKPDNDTITIDSNGVLTATAQMPGVATTTNVGVVKPDNDTIKIDSNGVLTATAQMPGVATTSSVGVVKPDGTTITVDGEGTLTCSGKNLVKSVNGVGADAQGNVQLDGLVKSVNGVNADASGNVTISTGAMLMPDYSSGINITSSLTVGKTWTAPESGILIHTSLSDYGACYISHTNANNHSNWNLHNWLIYNNTVDGDYQSALAIVNKNLIVYGSDISVDGTLMFYPFK